MRYIAVVIALSAFGLQADAAHSVATWLSQHGVESDRLRADGYGLERPIADNASDTGRATNRRVEFKITDEDSGPPKPTPHPSSSQPNSGSTDDE